MFFKKCKYFFNIYLFFLKTQPIYYILKFIPLIILHVNLSENIIFIIFKQNLHILEQKFEEVKFYKRQSKYISDISQ